MFFHNEGIDPLKLPQCESIDFQPLLSSYKRLQHIQSVIFFIVFLIGGFALYKFNDFPNLWIIIFTSALTLFSVSKFILIQLGFSHKGYAIREHDVHYKTGFINRKVITIPINRIQHMEIMQGVISRMLKLAKLKLFTAGNSSSDLSLRGISPETALQLKELLTEKIYPDGQN